MIRLLLVSMVASLCLISCHPPSELAQSEVKFAGQMSSPVLYIRIPRSAVTPEFLRRTGFNEDHFRDRAYAFGYVHKRELAAFEPREIAQTIQLDEQAWARQRFDARTLRPIEDWSPPADKNLVFEDYHSYQSMTDELQQLAGRYAEMAELRSAGRSAQGRELWYMHISEQIGMTKHRPKIIFIGNMHGDEVVSRELMIYHIRRLLTEYESNPRIKALIDHAEIFVMPSMNPDGFEMRRRHSAEALDLNRDFPEFVLGEGETPEGRGKETQAVMALFQREHFQVALNFHGGEVCVNIPWDAKPNQTSKYWDDVLISALARQYADKNATMKQNHRGSFNHGVTYGYEWYKITGGMQDWSINYQGSLHATVELSFVKWPEAETLGGYWNENKESLLGFMESSLVGVHVLIKDSEGNEIKNAAVTFGNGRRTLFNTAYVSHPTAAGPQNIMIEAQGFKPLRARLGARPFAGVFAPIVLERAE